MRFELSLPLLGLLLCVVGAAGQEELLVEFSGTTVTIACPFPEGIIKLKQQVTNSGTDTEKYIIENYDSSPLNVSCSSGGNEHNMYLKARVCTNCVELDALAVTGIITADLLITFGVLILVYYFSKNKKGQGSTGASSQPRGQKKMQRPPPVPNPDYEPIRKGQREVYAGLESRGF
ncbi:CD3E protein, partial [Alectura lathami]|nr:CD3E protein [Alectura lathami]